MIYNNISRTQGSVTFDVFGGINRRIKADNGEFRDMQNLCHSEYPCLRSHRLYKDMGFSLPDNVEVVKMIIPKRLLSAMEGFSGVVYNKSTKYYEIYINGEAKRTDIPVFTDAVDYNGSIITLPQLKGYNYCTLGEAMDYDDLAIEPYRISSVGFKFYNSYSTSTQTTTPYLHIMGISSSWFKNRFLNNFKIGDAVAFYGFEGEFAKNNTFYPKSSTDYSNTISPTIATIKSYTSSGTMAVIGFELRNSLGEIINWPYGCGINTETPTDQTTGVFQKYVPKGSNMCVAHNRLWLCSESGEEILASSLGKPMEFYEFQGVSTDSWSGSVGTPGLFKGIISWHTRVLAFKEDTIHVVYGDLPSNFSIEKTYNFGCVDKNSIAACGDCVIWLSHDGFYAYSGTLPKKISHKLQTEYTSANAFSDGVRYYAYCTKKDGGSEFIVYDTQLKLFSKLEAPSIINGDFYEGKVYFADKNKVYALGEGEFGDFYGETPELSFDSFGDKSIIYACIRCKIKDGFLNFYTASGGGEFISHKGISKSGKHRLPIRYSPGDVLSFRIEGHGDVCISEIKLEVLLKTR